MKKIIIVNNNMKIGGVQKSLHNLLWEIQDQFEVTLYLFNGTGEYMSMLPPGVKVQTSSSLFRYLGMSQEDCRNKLSDYLIRGILAAGCRIFGRAAVMRLILFTQEELEGSYDCAVSYLHNGNPHSFYGGVNEFVLKKIKAKQKIAFLHCDYRNCGGNAPENNQLYMKYDKIAACSDGCRKAFLEVLPEFSFKCVTAVNFHRYDNIRLLADSDTYQYEQGKIHLLCVGRLAHEKGFERAIRAAAYCIVRNISLMLHFVGTGGMMTELEKLAKELDIGRNVCFHGEQTNPYRFMKQADLLLLTSYHEAAPMVIEEARCVGLPVLSVETTSSEDMILRQRCGWVCANEQPALNRELLSLLQDMKNLRELKSELRNVQPDNILARQQFRTLLEG